MCVNASCKNAFVSFKTFSNFRVVIVSSKMSQDSLSKILKIFRLLILQHTFEVYVSKFCKDCRAYQVVLAIEF